MTPTEIKQTRQALNLTQKEFAAKIGCSYRSIQNWEGGQRKPSGIAIKAMSRIKPLSGAPTSYIFIDETEGDPLALDKLMNKPLSPERKAAILKIIKRNKERG